MAAGAGTGALEATEGDGSVPFFRPIPIPTLTSVSMLALPFASRSSSHSSAPRSNRRTMVDPPKVC